MPIFTYPLKVGVCIPIAKATQLCSTLYNSMDYTVQGILQARILEWVAFCFSRGSSQPRDRNQVSCIAGRFFTSWATSEACIPVRGPIMGLKIGSLYLETDLWLPDLSPSWYQVFWGKKCCINLYFFKKKKAYQE